MSASARQRVQLGHLIETQKLEVDVTRALATPMLLDRLAEINRRCFAPVLAQMLDAFAVPGQVTCIDELRVNLGRFSPDDLGRAEEVLRDRLRVALAHALRDNAVSPPRESEDRALISSFEHYMLHGTWPAGRAIPLDTPPTAMLAQLIADDPLALVAMLRRRGSSDALLRRLVAQIPERLLAALLHRLAPVHAAYVLVYLGEVRESHAAERLISATPAELGEMLWTIILRDALQQSGLQANRKAFLRRLLAQLARNGGTTLAALIAQLRRGLPRVLARRRSPGSLVAVLSELIAEEPALLLGEAAIAELAALLSRPRLRARERREARRLIDAIGSERLRWLMLRLASHDPLRLGAAIGEVLPLRIALGSIWDIDPAGLPAALEALASDDAERVALLALAAQSASRGAGAAHLAQALLCQMRSVAPGAVRLVQATAIGPSSTGGHEPLAELAAALAAAAQQPSPATLSRIGTLLARASAADSLAARQCLRSFAAADPARFCNLLGYGDSPGEAVGHLLPQHLRRALKALAGAARCSTAEWHLLLAVAAAAHDSDLPEHLLNEAAAKLARSRNIRVSRLRAQLQAAALATEPAQRAAIASLRNSAAHAGNRLASRHAALEQVTLLAERIGELGVEEHAAALAQLLPLLSGVAPAVLRARLVAGPQGVPRLQRVLAAAPSTALLRLALLLSIDKASLRKVSHGDLPAIIARLLDDPPTGADQPDRGTEWPSRSDEGMRWPAPQRGGLAAERRIAALIRARPFAALRLFAEASDTSAALAPLLEKPQTAPLLFAAAAPAERDRAVSLAHLLTGSAGRLAIAPTKLARALARTAAAGDWRSRGGTGFTAEWLRQLLALASLSEQAAVRRLLGRLPHNERIDIAQAETASGRTHPPGVLDRARILLGVSASRSISAVRRALDHSQARARLTRELSEADLVRLLAILAPTATGGLLHAAERLAAARRACAVPLTRPAQWDCILAAARSAHPVPQLVSLFLDGAEEAPPPPAPLRARIEALLEASLEGMRDAPLRIALDLRKRERARRATQIKADACGDPPAVLHIANAGLVLAAAFLPRLFQSLDYIVPEGSGWRWSHSECPGRAAHLLQWLVDTNTDAPEPQLALNKLLCGLAPAEPLAVAIALTDQELRAGHTLLRTILASWPPLAESGGEALRETFFQREGRLTRVETGWRLEVETRVLDILLDQLPWGFATILHPWMPAPLAVQWR